MDDIDALAEELHAAASGLARAARRAETLPTGESWVLATLERDGPQSIAELAERRAVRHQTVAKIVAQLEASKLISKAIHPDDRRMVLVRVSARGRTALKRDRTARAVWLAAAIRTELTATQQKQLPRLAETLAALAAYEPAQ